MLSSAQRIAKSTIFRNALSLYGVQVCRKLIPLVSLPYLGRVLGPGGWGSVALAQSVGEFIVMVIEFGFNLSATREIARHRDAPERCAGVVSGVLGAQAILSVLALLGGLAAMSFVPSLQSQPRLLGAGLVYGLAQGLMPLWFFQGLEKMSLAATLEVSGKLLGLVGLFIFVRQPGDEWKVLGLQALAPALSTIVGLWLVHRVIPFRRPDFAVTREALRTGWSMFLMRSGLSLYSVGNVFVLGLFASDVLVGYFAAAEKLTKAVSGLLLPIREAIYPRLSHLALHDPSKSAPLARLGAIAMGIGGLGLGLCLFFSADFVLPRLMGAQFAPAAPVLRILAILPMVIALTDSVGLQWLLPFGRENAVNKAILGGGLLNLVLAMIFAPRFQHIGMAWCVVTAETVVCLWLAAIVMRSTNFLRKPMTVLGSPVDSPVADLAGASKG